MVDVGPGEAHVVLLALDEPSVLEYSVQTEARTLGFTIAQGRLTLASGEIHTNTQIDR